MFHLAWFLNTYGIQPWNPAVEGPWTGNNERTWMKPDIYIDLASSLERAGFDYLLIADQTQIDYHFKGSAEAALRMALYSPKNDPMPLVPLITQRTKHIGIVPTITSTFYPPYLAARLLSTLDHLTEGRVGFNLVTAISEVAALNFGLDTLQTKDTRYEMATEWVEVVKALMESWGPDAIKADVENAIFADHNQVRTIDHVGKYYKCRGPLSAPPGPQRSIPMIEAGNSPAGRDLAARHSESILAGAGSIEAMKAFREDMHTRLKGYGRDPKDCKILFMMAPVLGSTDEEAREKVRISDAIRKTPAGMENYLYWISRMSGVDFGAFEMDTLCGDVLTQIEEISGKVGVASIKRIFQGKEDEPLQRVLEASDFRKQDHGLVGSPDTVASKMEELMQEVGADGFLFNLPTIRRTIVEVTDGLAPVLQRRGLIRDGYEGKTFRENLMAF